MNNSYKLIEEGRKDELWSQTLRFLSLSRKEFRDIQKRLMLEQITLLGSSRIGRNSWGEKYRPAWRNFAR